ncbi:PTS system mannitol-specific EIICB component [Brevibacillus agri]|uniref:PTS system mannitol-specific EIICB component n=1 Tax=Brevibacillus agri TaxID=51101 RepID=A0A3M8AST2_9BACL|nr:MULTISPECIES: PTS mannitol transporter subunit IICBA [Brevibacillus]EJL46039.1 PTS system, mannitol-specific IIC component [Brevibacillus sp. CF112]MBG9567391.1 PTS system mannitol-specific transporter subunit IIBC [Brevibacillus agri]MBY0052598.1 PTS mannitol transporter subunit IICBA [Brevibacillus agri]MDR9504652.1 PTS mannitol transporter subunit IICBA [Brevibacillus agri]MED1641782.1 PTS mannitol transporter subunit IICBA [Brevibacillus agri]
MENLATKNQSSGGVRVSVQKFGRFLSAMVMPNIGAFIAWGLITALFIPTGRWPNEELAKLVVPMITYLLPLLIGYTGGKMIHDVRGGVIGAVATMGIIVGSDIPMFLGAMIMGPLGGWIMKKVDQLLEGRIRSGFEMLINNFSAGIIGGVLAIIAFLAIGPVVTGLSKALASGVQVIVDAGLLPLASILVEPAKMLFLNNAINHGIFSPIGLEESVRTGKSIFFLMETNPGPGLGILLAYWLAGRGNAKQSAPGAVIIHFFGGIHEIYFPYILMNPRLVLAAIGGGMAGVFTFTLLGAGLVSSPSPGSIFALSAMAPRGGLLPVLAGVVAATVVSFVIAAALLKMGGKSDEDELEKATEKMQELKGKKQPAAEGEEVAAAKAVVAADVKKVVFSCDAGMGSSAMGAASLRKKFKDAGLGEITVINTAINDIPDDADIVITHKSLTERARAKAPSAEHISIDNFLNSPEYDKLVKRLG